VPTSATEGKQWIYEKSLIINPKRILDIGPGIGTYYNLLSEHLNAEWVGVEIWEPYIECFKLNEKYKLIIGDIRTVDWSQLGKFDLTICGDILEHMTISDALVVWDNIRIHSKWVLLSIPIIIWAQGELEGNPYEEHLSTWTDESCRSLSGVIDGNKGEAIGVYLARGEHIL
jgi:SAM-dependent methyltransferase